jgi:hypothetical protein
MFQNLSIYFNLEENGFIHVLVTNLTKRELGEEYQFFGMQ